ncbi:LuxR C-terminal-related transcriptional regulator [Synechocystis salina]|jgi:DNA-binding CsgD family transcriptional regulator|uniref:LuxR family transcriptional regulator n=1 Tax=Synechocystis salina LEGE 00031 TaxID=1828736 RepID=A0ABR9VTS3_9SYNC|nr:LuxR C-terminal-related transcriptional regulator [Synechocystis salina]MBE9242894.1 LuxR family transcriptional regulator [Synechocystis salina LEGE 00041]MBE9253838.1 LuxR family transcriptional regulator [Synechocystis salina LEGE 00031]
MVNSLHALFQAIATATSEQTLRHRLMDSMGDHFRTERWGVYLLDNHDHLASVDVIGVSDSFVERYEQMGRAVDPVMGYVMENHAPAHEELVLPGGEWKQSALYQYCCSEYDHEHIMTGPIVGQGHLIGTIHFARKTGARAFDAKNLAELGAVCSHVSACLAALRRSSAYLFPDNLLAKRLTLRERQIADLVAKGLTNAEIGTELWITQNTVKQALKRMFRKLEVSARAELVAKLRN